MLHLVLPAIVGELNGFLRRQLDETADKAVLTNLAEDSGTLVVGNQVICTLVNIEQERITINQLPTVKGRMQNPPTNLIVYLLFAANSPTDYRGALKDISLVLAFFQGKQVFTRSNTPDLPEGVEKITAELYNLDMHQLSNLWSSLGAKALPSVLMKLRMLSISRDLILDIVPEITSVDTNTRTISK